MTERLRAYIDTQLGDPERGTERVVAHYAELIGELKRIEALADPSIGTVDESANESSRRWCKLAARLRIELLAASGDDDVLPMSWREAWNWARMKNAPTTPSRP